MKNYLKITLILILAIILVGCSKKAKEIRPTQIFSQKEGTYYVYFYKENCSACENLQPRLNEYIQYSHSKQGKNAPKIYKVNVLSMPNLDASENWQEEIIGATNVMSITIGTTPTLLLIENKEVKKVFVGRTNITNELDRIQGK